MKLLPCPHLGPRPLEEFVYGGAERTAPDPATCTDEAWAAYVFHREGQPRLRPEWWYHRPSGTWFVLERDTGSDAIAGSEAAGAASTESAPR